MKRKKFERYRKLLTALYVMITAVVPILVYVLSRSIAAAICTAAAMLLLCVAAYLLHQLDNTYISGVVADLSRLTDVLLNLEEKEIFPENEDNMLSKLQSKVIKLTRILKKKEEAALQEQENIKGLVSDISHQLKTPLANLKMYSEFLEDETLSDEKRREYVAILRLSVERLNFLSGSMIKISRLEGGLIHLDMHKQSLNETVLKAVKDIYPKAKKKGTEIVYSEEADIVLSHDRNWTAEAVFNLLDNAVKYSESEAKIYLSVKQFGLFAAIEVTDENKPVPEEEQNKIFMRFYRGSNSRNREGIGIGLYLSREIAIRQGGYMNLKTSDNGNTFSFVLYKEA